MFYIKLLLSLYCYIYLIICVLICIILKVIFNIYYIYRRNMILRQLKKDYVSLL